MPASIDNAYPSHYEGSIVLEDGTEVFSRPVIETDGPLLLELFGRISPQTLYLRFLKELDSLPLGMLHDFTHLDYSSAFALAVLVEEKGRQAIVAVARYARDPREEHTDLAVLVRDDWQGLGMGTRLLERLVGIGRKHGVERFVTVTDPGNTAIRKTLSKLGCEVTYSPLGGLFQVEIIP